MPFDAQAPAEVTARDRMVQLRDFLAELPDANFDYGCWQRNLPCGTVACIAGWQGIIMHDPVPVLNYKRPQRKAWRKRMATSLGLSDKEGYDLFVRATDIELGDLPSRVETIAVLDHYLATGEIDWSVAMSMSA